MKMRILSRARALEIFRLRTFGELDAANSDERVLAEFSCMSYMLTDGKDVKTYHDTAMGGWVVEYGE